MLTVFAGFFMQSKLVDISLLSVAEVDWLNEYHSQVWEKVYDTSRNCFHSLYLLALVSWKKSRVMVTIPEICFLKISCRNDAI
jgi:hypothetical protein